MGHGREYSESVAGTVDVEVRRLMDAAHTEAWEILVEYRDVLDALVLELLEKETLNQAELEVIFAPITKRPPREVWLSSEQRAVSDRPPVLTPAEQAEQDGVVVPQDEAAAAKDEHPAVAVVEVPPNQTPEAPWGSAGADGVDGSTDKA
jgi:cell division protease FtsH